MLQAKFRELHENESVHDEIRVIYRKKILRKEEDLQMADFGEEESSDRPELLPDPPTIRHRHESMNPNHHHLGHRKFIGDFLQDLKRDVDNLPVFKNGFGPVRKTFAKNSKRLVSYSFDGHNEKDSHHDSDDENYDGAPVVDMQGRDAAENHYNNEGSEMIQHMKNNIGNPIKSSHNPNEDLHRRIKEHRFNTDGGYMG